MNFLKHVYILYTYLSLNESQEQNQSTIKQIILQSMREGKYH